MAVADEHGDEVDGLGQQRARDRDDGLLDELLHAAQRAERGAGVDRADTAGVSGAPGLEEIERLGAAHLADRDAVGTQAQAGPHEIGQRDDAILGPHGDEVGRGALKLARVFDQDDAVGGLGDFGQERVDQRGLAAAGPARDEDVGAGSDACPQRRGLGRQHDPGRRIVVEREHRDGGLADREGGRGDDGRQQPLEPLAAFGQLGRDARGPGVNLDANMVRHQTDDALAIRRAERHAGVGNPFAQPIDPQPAVRVQHHLDHGGIIQPGRNRRPQRRAQHPRAA